MRKPLRRALVIVTSLTSALVGLTVWATRDSSARFQVPAEPAARTPPPVEARTAARQDGRLSFTRLREAMPLYPHGGPLIPVGEPALVNGVPLMVASFETPDKADAVMAHYAVYFNEMKWWWLNTDQLSAQGFPYPGMTATDPSTSFQYSVMVMEHTEGSTVVISMADMVNRQPAAAQDLKGLPRYPGTRPSVVSSGDAEGEATSVTFDTDAPAAEVEKFYREALPAAGFRLAEDGPGPRQAPSPFRRFVGADTQWILSISSKGGQTLVSAQRTRREAE